MSTSDGTKDRSGTAETAVKLAQTIIAYEEKVNQLPADQRRTYILDLVSESYEALIGYRKRRSE